jgi:hypothetical protein
MGSAYSIKGEKRNACRLLLGNPEGKESLGRPRRRWADNIKMDLKIGCSNMDRTDLTEDIHRRRVL